MSRIDHIGQNGNTGEHYKESPSWPNGTAKDGYYYDDEEDKLKPLKPEPQAADLVNNPPHYQTDGIECIDAIRASLGLDGFVAYCRGNAIKYSWRAGKKDDTAQDLRKAAWYLNRAADELLKNSEHSVGVNK